MPRALIIAVQVLMLLIGLAGLGWALWRTLKRSDDPARLIFKWVLTATFTGGLIFFAHSVGFTVFGAAAAPLACVVYGVAMSILWAPQIARFFAKPLTSIFDGGDQEIEPEPLYSMALAKIKRGQYQAAAFAVKEQLARFPNDFYGHSLLAQLQAEHLADLPGAQLTIERLCDQPGHAPKSIALALNQLADWHLKYGQDVDAARQTLEKIIALFPDTQEAHMAGQRAAHLGTTEKLLEAYDRPAVHVRPGVRNLGLLKDGAALQPPPEDPAAKAAEYVKHLEAFPQDIEAREKLASLYATHYQRLDLALEQLAHVLEQPGLPARDIAHCLNLMADLQIKCANDAPAAEQTLQRIVDLFPESPLAENARQRIAHLKLELRGNQPARVIKLGSYPQNIGLKNGPPRENR